MNWLEHQDQFWQGYHERFKAEINRQLKAAKSFDEKKSLRELLQLHSEAIEKLNDQLKAAKSFDEAIEKLNDANPRHQG